MNPQIESKSDQKIVFLKGKTTTLRPPLESDIPTLMRWVNDPEVRTYIARLIPALEVHEKEYIEKANSATSVALIIEVDGKPIGNMGLHGIHWVDGIATTGAMIGEKEYWGKGYGKDAKMALLEYAFNSLRLRQIYSYVISFNKRSLRYSLGCGYKKIGVYRNDTFRFGKFWDVIALCVTRDSWLPFYEKWKEGDGAMSEKTKSTKKKRRKL